VFIFKFYKLVVVSFISILSITSRVQPQDEKFCVYVAFKYSLFYLTTIKCENFGRVIVCFICTTMLSHFNIKFWLLNQLQRMLKLKRKFSHGSINKKKSLIMAYFKKICSIEFINHVCSFRLPVCLWIRCLSVCLFVCQSIRPSVRLWPIFATFLNIRSPDSWILRENYLRTSSTAGFLDPLPKALGFSLD
jgi:hypothetical protein